jgi:serine/threonine protein kinase
MTARDPRDPVGPDRPAETFGPYLVYERIGVGGMATVHRAKERGIEGFERVVALKRLLPHLAGDESFVRAFVREAKLASMLQHANVVQIYELGRVGAEYFISMEYIEGRDVRKLLRQARRVTGPPTIPVVVATLAQVCDALDYAHNRHDEDGQPLGLVHRDVSPSNLIISPSGHLKVIDFGIAKAQTVHLRTQTGRVKGKLAYMSPEGTRGQPVDQRSDLFSLGVICHELLTARPLFATKNDYQTLMRVQTAEVAPPSTYNQRCPPELDAITLKALAKDPAERWQSAGELRDALHELRASYQMEASHREVAAWVDWAFAQQAPPTGRHPVDRPTLSTDTPVRVHFASTGSVPHTPAPGMQALPPAEADDEIIEIAWGGRDDDAAPVLLDDVPDVSDKFVVPSSETLVGYPARSRTPTEPPGWAHGSDRVIPRRRRSSSGALAAPVRSDTEFGAAIVQRRETGRRSALVALLLLAVAAAGVALVITRGQGGQSAAVGAGETAILKFAVEPAEATVRLEGREPITGSHSLAVAPGSYRIEVSHPGHESWVSTVDLAEHETQTLRVALQPGGGQLAKLTVRSTPPGLIVALDGEPVTGQTPVTVEVTPGPHAITLATEHGQVWEHRFEASADTMYELHPMLDDEVARARRHHYRRVRAEEAANAPTVELDTAASSAGRAALPRAAAGGPAPLPLDPGAPPVAATPRPSEPVIIPPSEARKLSGSIPALSARSDLGVERVSAKLCIDPRGAVTDVTLVTPLPDEVSGQLLRALRGWRYQPHRQDDRAVAACFVQTFRLQ